MCESNPCLNGGVCRGYRRNYLCMCKDGFFGDQCQMCKYVMLMLCDVMYDIQFLITLSLLSLAKVKYRRSLLYI